MKLKDVKIQEGDFDLFVELGPKEKIEFLCDATELGTEASVLKQIEKVHKKIFPDELIVATQDYQVGRFRLCVTLTKNEVHLNSDSLKAIRKFVAKLWNDGLLLSRLDLKKTEFDMYRYYKAYKIIGKGHPFCPN